MTDHADGLIFTDPAATAVDPLVAYAEAADFVRFLDRNADSARFVSLIGRVRGGQKFDQAARDAYDADLRTLEYQWKDGLSQRFTLMPGMCPAPTMATSTLCSVIRSSPPRVRCRAAI